MKKFYKSVMLLMFGCFSVNGMSAQIGKAKYNEYAQREIQDLIATFHVEFQETPLRIIDESEMNFGQLSPLYQRFGNSVQFEVRNIIRRWPIEMNYYHIKALLYDFSRQVPLNHVGLIIHSSFTERDNVSTFFRPFHDRVLKRLLGYPYDKNARLVRANMLIQSILDPKWNSFCNWHLSEHLFQYWKLDETKYVRPNIGNCYFHEIGTILQTLGTDRPIEYAPMLLPASPEARRIDLLCSFLQYNYRYRLEKCEKGATGVKLLDFVLNKKEHQNFLRASFCQFSAWGTFELKEMLRIINTIAKNVPFPDNFGSGNVSWLDKDDDRFHVIKHGIEHLIQQTPLPLMYFQKMSVAEAQNVMNACGDNRWLQQWMLVHFFVEPYNIDEGRYKEKCQRCTNRKRKLQERLDKLEKFLKYMASNDVDARVIVRELDLSAFSQELNEQRPESAMAVNFLEKKLPPSVVRFLMGNYESVIIQADSKPNKKTKLMDSLRAVVLKNKNLEDYCGGISMATWIKK